VHFSGVRGRVGFGFHVQFLFHQGRNSKPSTVRLNLRNVEVINVVEILYVRIVFVSWNVLTWIFQTQYQLVCVPLTKEIKNLSSLVFVTDLN